MLEMKIQTGLRRYVAPADLPRVMGAARALAELGEMIDHLIAQVDMIEGDADLEECDVEDSFVMSGDAIRFAKGCGAGCPVADAADPAFPEWHTMRGASKGQPMPVMHHDDDEDDDPSGQCDEDGVNTSLAFLWERGGAGCAISDTDYAVDDQRCDDDGRSGAFPAYSENQGEPLPWSPADDLRGWKPHRDRIRATRCARLNVPSWDLRDYLLNRPLPLTVAADLN